MNLKKTKNKKRESESSLADNLVDEIFLFSFDYLKL